MRGVLNRAEELVKRATPARSTNHLLLIPRQGIPQVAVTALLPNRAAPLNLAKKKEKKKRELSLLGEIFAILRATFQSAC